MHEMPSSDRSERSEEPGSLSEELARAIAEASEALTAKGSASKKRSAETLMGLRLAAKALEEGANDPAAAIAWLQDRIEHDELTHAEYGKHPNVDAYAAAAAWIRERMGN